jgi:ribonuclease BN (tRNA processing enzyme)
VAGQASVLRGVRCSFDVAQRQLRLTPEGKPGVRENHAARRALQQASRQLAFEATDLLAKRRGDNAEFRRCAAHAPVFDNRHKIAKLAQFQLFPLSSTRFELLLYTTDSRPDDNVTDNAVVIVRLIAIKRCGNF